MKVRVLTAVVACLILLPVLIFSETPALPIMIALLSLIAIYEMSACIGTPKVSALTVPLYLIAALAPFWVRYTHLPFFLLRDVLAAVCVLALYDFAILTFSHGKFKLAEVATLFLTTLYILIGFNAILYLRDYETGGKYLYLVVFIGAWITDTFAYFCGMLFGKGGKHKLIPDVSPKKTVEGCIGGIVFCIISMILFALVLDYACGESVNYAVFAVAGLLISVVSQLGDLLMSLIKRTYGLKDYGKIFPGHGGVLDRFDSNLAVAVLLAVFCSYFNFLV